MAIPQGSTNDRRVQSYTNHRGGRNSRGGVVDGGVVGTRVPAAPSVSRPRSAVAPGGFSDSVPSIPGHMGPVRRAVGRPRKIQAVQSHCVMFAWNVRLLPPSSSCYLC